MSQTTTMDEIVFDAILELSFPQLVLAFNILLTSLSLNLYDEPKNSLNLKLFENLSRKVKKQILFVQIVLQF